MFFLSSTNLVCSLSSLFMPSFQERKRLAAPLTVLETVLRSVRSTYGKGWEDDELFGRFGDCEVLLLLCIGRIGDVPRRRSAMTRLSCVYKGIQEASKMFRSAIGGFGAASVPFLPVRAEGRMRRRCRHTIK